MKDKASYSYYRQTMDLSFSLPTIDQQWVWVCPFIEPCHDRSIDSKQMSTFQDYYQNVIWRHTCTVVYRVEVTLGNVFYFHSCLHF
jgi:hypothetical protein